MYSSKTNKLELGMIVRVSSYIGIVVGVNDGLEKQTECSIDWFDPHCPLAKTWWNINNVEILEDPAAKYRKQYCCLKWKLPNGKIECSGRTDNSIWNMFKKLCEKYPKTNVCDFFYQVVKEVKKDDFSFGWFDFWYDDDEYVNHTLRVQYKLNKKK